MALENILAGMKDGKVAFSYKKKDDELRQAVGTRNAALIAEDGGEAPVEWIPRGKAIAYYDLNSHGIRSFASDKLM